MSLPVRNILLASAGVGSLFVLILGFMWTPPTRAVRTWGGTISSSAPTSSSGSQEISMPAKILVQPVSTSTNLNDYWLTRINALRREKGLRLLRTDERLVATASEWAEEMRERGEITHARVDGKTMHQWIDAKDLDFSERNSEHGWKINYFVENIARSYAEPTPEGMKAALDRVLDDFLFEGSGGAHYESIYHQDWNSVGLGFSFATSTEKTVRVYFAFHYGSLK